MLIWLEYSVLHGGCLYDRPNYHSVRVVMQQLREVQRSVELFFPVPFDIGTQNTVQNLKSTGENPYHKYRFRYAGS